MVKNHVNYKSFGDQLFLMATYSVYVLPDRLLDTVFHHGSFQVAPSEQFNLLPNIQATFQHLTILEQHLLILHYGEELSHPAIARQLPLPITRIRRSLARSVYALRIAGNPSYAARIARIVAS